MFGYLFFSLRWGSLGMLIAFSALSWLAIPRKVVHLDSVKQRVALYLFAWSITVIMSDYATFSGLRLAAHAMVLVPVMILIPECLRVRDYALILKGVMVIVGSILLVSALGGGGPTGSAVHGWYSGIVGNANAFGHMAAVGLVLFTHAFLSSPRGTRRKIFAALALLSVVLLLKSYARSSALAAVIGLGVLYLFYRAQISRYVALAATAVALALVAVPNFAEQISERVFKHDIANRLDNTALGRLLVSREAVFEQQIEGFRERPLVGWGFGVDSDTDLSLWQGEFQSTGFTGRDPVNDTLYTLETGGVVGFLAYAALVALLVGAWTQRRFAAAAMRTDRCSVLYIAFLSLASMLAVLFQLDGTALAAGNFFAVLLWLSIGCVTGLSVLVRAEARRRVRRPTLASVQNLSPNLRDPAL